MTRRQILAACVTAPLLRARTLTIGPEASVEEALRRAGAGSEVVLRPGFYRGIRVPRECEGVTIRSEIKWKAVVLGSTEHGVFVSAPRVTIDGLEVVGSRIDGIKAAADGVTIRNCWVHNNSSQGVTIHGFKDWTIERNLIEFNGQHPQLQHGIYADGENGAVRSNIVRHNSGYGVQLYPEMRGVTVENNLIHGHSKKGGIVLAAPSGRNRLVNNTIADNAYGIRLMGGSGQAIANNIIVGPSPISRDAEAGEPDARANWTDDPKFVDRQHEVYFLAADSPAIGKGAARLASATDCWGRRRDARVEPGAFPFVPALANGESRAAWHNGWAYRFRSQDPKMEMPDLWIPPQ
jgi:parallel beta-helix repeat protein